MSQNSLSLNIGLCIGSSAERISTILIADALFANLPDLNIRECYIRTAKSGEPTACIRLTTTLRYDALGAAINAICTALQQEAIAGKFAAPFHPVHQFLIGPKAEAWGGEFSDEYWLPVCAENEPQPADDALRNLHGWAVAGHNETLSGWFERNTDGTGGGFYDGIAELVQRGLKFRADFEALRITLTGGF